MTAAARPTGASRRHLQGSRHPGGAQSLRPLPHLNLSRPCPGLRRLRQARGPAAESGPVLRQRVTRRRRRQRALLAGLIVDQSPSARAPTRPSPAASPKPLPWQLATTASSRRTRPRRPSHCLPVAAVGAGRLPRPSRRRGLRPRGRPQEARRLLAAQGGETRRSASLLPRGRRRLRRPRAKRLGRLPRPPGPRPPPRSRGRGAAGRCSPTASPWCSLRRCFRGRRSGTPPRWCT